MTYATSLSITLRTAWKTWYEASSMACTLTAELASIVKFVFLSAVHIAFAAAVLTRYAWDALRIWVDTTVEASLERETLTLPPSTVAGLLPPASPKKQPAMAQVVSQPVATITIPLESPETLISEMTVKQLKSLAKTRGLSGYSRLRKPGLIELLA